jgi:hypothetical protein
MTTDDPAIVGDETALAADVVSGLLLDHPDAPAYTSRLATIRDQLQEMLDELQRPRVSSATTDRLTLRPWTPGPLDPANGRRTLSRADRVEIRRPLRAGESRVKVAETYDITRDRVAQVVEEE